MNGPGGELGGRVDGGEVDSCLLLLFSLLSSLVYVLFAFAFLLTLSLSRCYTRSGRNGYDASRRRSCERGEQSVRQICCVLTLERLEEGGVVSSRAAFVCAVHRRGRGRGGRKKGGGRKSFSDSTGALRGNGTCPLFFKED
jgi:hypothetical protein